MYEHLVFVISSGTVMYFIQMCGEVDIFNDKMIIVLTFACLCNE